VRLRLIALVLLVIAGTAAGVVLTRVDSSRDAWLAFATALALAAVTGVVALTRGRQSHVMPEVERYFALAPEMVVLAGFDGYWKRVNPTVQAVLGYTEREALGRSFMEFVHPDDRGRSEEAARRVLEGATIHAFENRMLCKDGSHKWIEWTVTPVPQERVMYGVGRDVTDRRRSQSEQAALQRIATLVAQEVPQADVFGAIAEEIGRLLGTEEVRMLRFDADESAVVVGGSGRLETFPLGSRLKLDGDSVALRVLRTGRPARFDDYGAATGSFAKTVRSIGVRAVVGAPVFVQGRLWGAITTGATHDEPLPPDSEARLDQFTKLMATAIANAESRQALAELAEEQAALRRVATLVAQGAPPQDLFDAVAEEVGRLLLAANVSIGRYEPDDSITSMASWSSAGPVFTPGVRWPIKGTNVAWMMLQTGRPARIDSFEPATDPIGVAVREAGYKSAIGSPIVVDGHLWGAISAASSEGPMPPGSEARLSNFSDLVATAIANADSRSELAASRRRIVAASDEARRRIERDLHDGVQQQLVSLSLELGMMKANPQAGHALGEQVARVSDAVGSILDALLEVARGIHPSILAQGGLEAALDLLARRSIVPVELDAHIDGSLPDAVEVAAYYVASEALTNVAKHARASVVHVDVTTNDQTLRLLVRDDGAGGASLGEGSGLVGLRDRVEALGGTIKVDSSAGKGTCVVVTLPTATEPDQEIENVLGPPQELGSPTSPA
jgi:PAS domain S-box-containing protein